MYIFCRDNVVFHYFFPTHLIIVVILGKWSPSKWLPVVLLLFIFLISSSSPFAEDYLHMKQWLNTLCKDFSFKCGEGSLEMSFSSYLSGNNTWIQLLWTLSSQFSELALKRNNLLFQGRRFYLTLTGIKIPFSLPACINTKAQKMSRKKPKW